MFFSVLDQEKIMRLGPPWRSQNFKNEFADGEQERLYVKIHDCILNRYKVFGRYDFSDEFQDGHFGKTFWSRNCTEMVFIGLKLKKNAIKISIWAGSWSQDGSFHVFF